MIVKELGHRLTPREKVAIYIQTIQDNKKRVNYQELKDNRLSFEHENVIIYYRPEEEELLPIIENTLSEGDAITTKLFGQVNDNHISLIIHASPNEIYENTSLVQTMGYFDDPKDVIGVSMTNLEEVLEGRMPGTFYFKSTLLHEYTHYRFQLFIKEQGLYVYRIPLWFHEGVAEYVGMYNFEPPIYPIKETAFSNLVTYRKWEEYRMDNYDVYLQSFFAIKYLIHQHGEEIIKKIIKETAKENNFNKGFKRATGLSLEDLQDSYLHTE